MGIDAGFDMVPRLTQSAEDKQEWSRFIAQIKEIYKKDEQVNIKSNYLVFNAGEHPTLPFEGHKFLRFSSKISGRIAARTNVEEYITTVTRIAKAHFGSRVQVWNDGADQSGHYSWLEVRQTTKSYEEPDQDEPQTSMSSLSIRANSPKNIQSLTYDIQSIPGRGRGLVARHELSEGSRILIESPILVVQSMSRESLEPILAAKLRSLPKEEQRQFLSLHNNHPGKYPFSGIVKTNALPCGSGSTIGAVYATISLINHSCLPNAHNNWNPDSEKETIHAIRPISIGEEITICYSSIGPNADRRTKLKQSFGFDCNCPTCSLPPSELQESDNRRLQIQRLDDAIGDPIQMMSNPTTGIANCKLLLDLLKQEHGKSGGALYARLYYDAFQISTAHGDRVRAAVFAEHAYKVRVLCEGEDSPQAKKMKSLMENPEGHQNFAAYSTRWRSKKRTPPEGLEGVEFDRWLWHNTIR